MSNVDWSKAPEGATHCSFSESWFKHDVSGVYVFVSDSWEKLSWASWQLDGFSCRPNQEWNGDGLPPVGCIVLNRHDEKRRVVAHDGDNIVCHTGVGYRGYSPEEQKELKPIRTPEQLAAESREMAIKEMWSVYWQPHAATAMEGLGLLYDAGYRKQVQPE